MLIAAGMCALLRQPRSQIGRARLAPELRKSQIKPAMQHVAANACEVAVRERELKENNLSLEQKEGENTGKRP